MAYNEMSGFRIDQALSSFKAHQGHPTQCGRSLDGLPNARIPKQYMRSNTLVLIHTLGCQRTMERITRSF